MSYAQNPNIISLPAAADYSSGVYRFGDIDSNGRFLRSGANEDSIGVSQSNDASAIDQPIGVAISGVTRVEASAAISKGDAIATAAAGKAATATTGQNVVAIAIEAAGADGDLIAVVLQNSVRTPA